MTAARGETGRRAPSISVVVAALLDSKALRSCLEIVRSQADEFSPPAEIVLVLNASREKLAEESLAALSTLCDVIGFEATPGKSHALNRAIDISRGEVIAFTDDDARPQPGWLERLASPLLEPGREPSLMGCGGRVVPELPEETPEWYRRMTLYRPTTLLGPRHDLGPRETEYSLNRKLGQSPIGANCAYRREVFASHRYATDLGPNFVTGTRGGEDTELGRRLLGEGMTLRYVADAEVVHRVDRLRISMSYCKQRFIAHGVEKVRSRRKLGRSVPSARSVRVGRQLCLARFLVLRLSPGWSRERVVLKRAVLRGMIAELEGRADQVLEPGRFASRDAVAEMTATRVGQLGQRIAEHSARLLRRFVDPATVYKTTGVMPYAVAPVRPKIIHELDEPPPFTEPPPPSLSGRSPWSTSRSRLPILAHVASVTDGIALSSGAVFDRRGRYHRLASHDHDFVDHPKRQARGFMPMPHRFFPTIGRFRGVVVALTTSSQDFYFHWIFDVLPRIHMAEQAGFGNGPFYVRAELPFQRQTLRILGVIEHDLIDPSKTRAIAAQNLIVPCHHVMPGRVFPKWSIDFLRSRILPHASVARGPATRLYVSRGNTGHRRVLNEPELLPLLSRYGFQSVRLEEPAFCDQVRLFRDAQIVVAPHGSGLANLVFCQPGAKVIELFPAGNIDLYYRLSKQLGLDYLYVKSREGSGEAMGSASYHINPADLSAALDVADRAR